MTPNAMFRLTTIALLTLVVVESAGAQVRTAPTRTPPAAAPAIPAVKSLSFASRSVPLLGGAHAASSTGGQEVVLRVELSGPAPCVERCGGKTVDGGLSGYMPVALSASDPVHFNAQRMLVPTGQTYGELAFMTAPVASQVALTVSAWSEGSAPQQARLTILPPVMTGFALEQSSAISGQSVKGVVHFSGPPASATAVRFQLQTTNGQVVSVPAWVALEPGKTAAEFHAQALGISQDQAVHVVAMYENKALPAPLSVRAAKLVSVENVFPCCDNPVRISLNGSPPPQGAIIELTSANPGRIVVPKTVTIQPDSSGITVMAQSIPGPSDDRVRITATYQGASKHWSVLSRKIVKPDLVLRDITFYDSFGNTITAAADGQPIKMCLTIRAQREGEWNPNLDAPPSVLRIDYQTPTGTGTTAGRTIDIPTVFTRDINRMYPPLTHCVTLPGLEQGMQTDITLTADLNDEVDESREGNNVEKEKIGRP